MPETPRPLRVAVIGAGPAGLVSARELRREGHTPVIFERAAGVGGTWLYDDGASGAEDPLGAGSSSSSIYASLRTNLPREVMGFLDFPFSAGAGCVDPRRFPGHDEVLRYLQEFARRFDLLGMVRLETEVLTVRREVGGNGWTVVYSRKLDGEKRESEEVFDAVVVCNGHCTEPRVADIAGIDAWPGRQLHSHSYRVPGPFHGEIVVIIGYQSSGADISRDIARVAKEVHVANRSLPAATCERQTGYTNLWIHSMVDRAEQDGIVVFRDGTRIKADVILHCTGYKYKFPFLGEDATISVDDNRVSPLYKHVFPPKLAPQISFIGLPFRSTLFPLYQLQSSWVAGVLSRRIALPSDEEMMQDVRNFYSDMEARGCPKRYTHGLGLKFEYEDWLAEQTGQEMIEEWRKVMDAAARNNQKSLPESYRDEWEDGNLLVQVNQHFTKYSVQ